MKPLLLTAKSDRRPEPRACSAPSKCALLGATASVILTCMVAGPGERPRLSAYQTSPIPTTNESTNWAGYVSSGSAARFTSVAATWKVPYVTAAPIGSSSTWVGVDGTATPDLVQAGTAQDETAHGPVYDAWYEFLPGNAVRMGEVRPGDVVRASVLRLSPDRWMARVQDITTGRAWAHAAAYQAPGTSAEWVEELPTEATTGKAGRLADFGTVRFTDMAVTGPGVSSSLARPVYLVSKVPERVLAHPVPYDATDASFSVSYGPPDPWPTSFPTAAIGHGARTSTSTTMPTSTTTSSPQSPTATTRSQPTTTTAPVPTTTAPVPTGLGDGLWLARAGGAVDAFGEARSFPAAPGSGTNPLVGITSAGHRGYWAASSDGGVFSYGARFFGSLPALGLHAGGTAPPVVGITAAPDYRGYLLATSDGGVFAFGDARFSGSCQSGAHCGAPVVAIASDPTNHGYWLVLANCTVIPFGGAPASSTAGCAYFASSHHTSVVAASARPSGLGVWMLLSDGRLYASGPKPKGSWYQHTGAASKSFVPAALAVTSDGGGAWVVSANGTIEHYGNAPALALGAGPGQPSTGPPDDRIVGAAGW